MSSRHGPRSGGNDLGDLNVHGACEAGASGGQARGGVEIVGFDDNIAAEYRGTGVAVVRGSQGPRGPDPVAPVGDRLPELSEPGAPRLLLLRGRGAAGLATESYDVFAHGNAPFGVWPAVTGLHPLRRTPPARIDNRSLVNMPAGSRLLRTIREWPSGSSRRWRGTPQVELWEHQDNPDVYCQPLPEVAR